MSKTQPYTFTPITRHCNTVSEAKDYCLRELMKCEPEDAKVSNYQAFMANYDLYYCKCKREDVIKTYSKLTGTRPDFIARIVSEKEGVDTSRMPRARLWFAKFFHKAHNMKSVETDKVTSTIYIRYYPDDEDRKKPRPKKPSLGVL